MPLPRDIANTGARPRTIADEQQQGELQVAWGHAMGRNNRVAKVFCYLSVMRAVGLIPAKARVAVSPSGLPVPQDFNAAQGNQAAHYLPGFVAISKPTENELLYLWDLVADATTREDIVALFRATQDLPPSYNRADSAAEGRVQLGPPGLKQFFQECCQYVVDQEPAHSPLAGRVLVVIARPVVAAAWSQWARKSILAYERASVGKDARVADHRPADVRMKPVTDLARGKFQEWTPADLKARVRDLDRTVHGRKNSVGEFQDQASFLRAYANVTNGEFPLSEAILNQIEARFGPKMPSWYEK